ncbi:hypothetical protein JTE90_024566 [Oedothorax gibbosus]|uniref:Sperm microtubule inner protein 1 C-terminal domain-containing protein n=1 Tax=Oedothorax gibbosus TaxID=931172 RepID=A0AAV6VBU7_9ARAC|nr:hypothetical protein JTE90_024566 [Oedothorax gibbosus]
MARNKIFDPAFQKAFTEAIYKEKKLKAKWHLDHGSGLNRVPDTFLWDDQPDDDEFVQLSQTNSQDCIPPILRERQHSSYSSGSRQSIEKELGAVQTKVEEEERPFQLMKPIPLRTKRLLYKGSSHDDEGKDKYLRKRRLFDPEEKYYFPLCSSWEYGWTFGQENHLAGPEYGRKEIIKKSFFRPNDPQLKPRAR